MAIRQHANDVGLELFGSDVVVAGDGEPIDAVASVERLLERGEGNFDGVGGLVAFLAALPAAEHTDHFEVHALGFDVLADGVDIRAAVAAIINALGAEQLIRNAGADHADLAALVDVALVEVAPRFHARCLHVLELRKITGDLEAAAAHAVTNVRTLHEAADLIARREVMNASDRAHRCDVAIVEFDLAVHRQAVVGDAGVLAPGEHSVVGEAVESTANARLQRHGKSDHHQ